VRAADVFPGDCPWEDVPVFLPNRMPHEWLLTALRKQLGPPVSPKSASNELDLSAIDELVNSSVARDPLPLALTLAPCLGLTLAPRLALA
jgi:hypothetical protein